MARKLDQIVVVDLEATCWKDRVPPEGQAQDIIEIGLTLLDNDTFERSQKTSILVKPERSTVSEFCTELTTITADMIDSEGVSFAEACLTLRKRFDARERVFASWGDFDRRAVERQCADMGVPYPFGPTHLNAKSLFALAHGLKTEVGLPTALKTLGFELEGTHHRGHDDAWNIARVLAETLKGLRS